VSVIEMYSTLAMPNPYDEALRRRVLRQLLIRPLRFTPVNEERRRGYAFEGMIALDRLLAGVLELSNQSGVPRGIDTCRRRTTRTIRAA
jgi:hypothetical protein